MTAKGWFKSSLLILFLLLPAGAAEIDEQIVLDLALPMPGSLVICGGGDVPDSVMLRFIELAGGTAARIVFIPTAAEGADTDEQDEDLEFFQAQPLGSLTVLHTRDRQRADDPVFLRPLETATGVWLGGGCQRLLVDVYQGTGVEQGLRRLFQRGGAIGGISAGAAVMSPVMIRGGFGEPETGPGFGLLPGTIIDQHFLVRRRQDRLLRVLADNPGLVGIGIDEGTALIVEGSRLSVMGKSCVVTCLPASTDWPEEVSQLQPGDEADLARLVRSASIRSQPRRPAADVVEAAKTTTLALAETPKPAATPASVNAKTATVKPSPVARQQRTVASPRPVKPATPRWRSIR
ncbi:MAG TPA: cyanophycinase [Castellaniella sp.]|nr:cyanophycinase [Castellaniella sp.]